MRKQMIAAMAVCMLWGCGNAETAVSENTDVNQTDEITIQEEDTSLTALRRQIKEADAGVGVGLLAIGRWSSLRELQDDISSLGYSESCAFIADMEESEILFLSDETSAVYLIVPCDENTSLSVNELPEREVLYRSEEGNPILVVSRILDEPYQEEVTLVWEGTLGFCLQNTDPSVLADSSFIYEIPIYDSDQRNIPAMFAFEKLISLEEVADKIELGMQCHFCGMEEIGDQMCYVFELGTDHEENFVHEGFYAVDPAYENVYEQNYLNGEWMQIGHG